jgi:hypothetical protein
VLDSHCCESAKANGEVSETHKNTKKNPTRNIIASLQAFIVKNYCTKMPTNSQENNNNSLPLYNF